MDIKERILETLKKELEPLGYRYIKSESKFKRNVSKDILVYLYYCASNYHRGYTTVTFYPNSRYWDIRRELQNQSIIDIKYWTFGFSCRLQWMRPDAPWTPWDFVFCVDDTEEIVSEKLKEMAWCVRTYLIPYLERVSHRSSALEEAIALNRRFLLQNEYLIPVMSCVWKHDKKAAMDYLKDRGEQIRELAKPEEWEFLARMKKGETLMPDEHPMHALSYDRYINNEARKAREWIESQEYDD